MTRVYGVIDDTVTPQPPTELLLDDDTPGATSILWTGSISAYVTVYQVYRDGVPVGTSNLDSFVDTTTQPSQTYSYTVQSVNAFGMASAPSEPLEVTVQANAAPVWDTVISTQLVSIGVGFVLDLTSVCNDPEDQTLTFTQVSGTLPSGVTLTGTNVSGVASAPETSYSATFRATDIFGSTADKVIVFDVHDPDVTAPTVPGTPTLVAVTTNSVSIAWAPSTDASGLTQYKIYRANVNPDTAFALRGTSTTPDWTDVNMQSGVTRRYQVSAVDASLNLNESAQSAYLEVTTLSSDTQAPTTPTGLAAVASGANQINLSWNASTDSGGSGLSGYRVYSSTTLNGTYTLLATKTTAQLTHQHTGLNPSTTRYYKVSAFDVAGNESNQSSSVNATTSTSSQLIKWHPGHGVSSGGIASLNSPGWSASHISDVAGIATIKHYQHRFYWGYLEPTRDNYRWDLVDDFVDDCIAAGKRAMIALQDRALNTGSMQNAINQGRLPVYLRDDDEFEDLSATGGIYTHTEGTKIHVFPMLYEEIVMDRLIALMEAMAARYNGVAMVEGFVTSELALDPGPGHSQDKYLTQMKRYVTAMKNAWLNTNVFMYANSSWSGDETRQVEFMNHMRDNRMLFSGPDLRPNDFLSNGSGGTQFQRMYYGLLYGHDYRSEMAHGPEIQGPNLGGNHTPTVAQMTANGFSPSTLLDFIYEHAVDPLNCSYITWLRKTYGSPDNGTNNDVFWNAASVEPGYAANQPYIRTWLSQASSAIPLNTTPPSNYNGLVNTN